MWKSYEIRAKLLNMETKVMEREKLEIYILIYTVGG